MIGQKVIEDRLSEYDFSSFPQSNLVIGDKGAGKHMFIDMVCEKFSLSCEDISEDISKELIDDLYLRTGRSVYVIDIVKLAKKHRYINKENALLKFIEEPPMLSKVFILVENKAQIIDTIINRCVLWEFLPYSIADLSRFKKNFGDPAIFTLLDTPGKVIEAREEEYYKGLFEVCNSIVANIHRASVSNTLSLSKHLSFVDADKYELKLFLRCLKLVMCNQYICTNDEKYYRSFELINEYIRKCGILNIDHKALFNSFILKLKGIYA